MVEQAVNQVIDELERENEKVRAEINKNVYSEHGESRQTIKKISQNFKSNGYLIMHEK